MIFITFVTFSNSFAKINNTLCHRFWCLHVPPYLPPSLPLSVRPSILPFVSPSLVDTTLANVFISDTLLDAAFVKRIIHK